MIRLWDLLMMALCFLPSKFIQIEIKVVWTVHYIFMLVIDCADVKYATNLRNCAMVIVVTLS